MANSLRTKYILIIVNMLLAFIVSVLGNKVAEITRLPIPALVILLLVALFICALGLVEYEHYLETGNIRQSLVFRSSRWVLKKTNDKIYTAPSRQRELCSIFGFAVSALILLSLISYDADDIARLTSPERVHNWVGLVGAYVSTFLFQKLGWLAFVIPIVLIAASWLILSAANNRSRKVADIVNIDRTPRA